MSHVNNKIKELIKLYTNNLDFLPFGLNISICINKLRKEGET